MEDEFEKVREEYLNELFATTSEFKEEQKKLLKVFEEHPIVVYNKSDIERMIIYEQKLLELLTTITEKRSKILKESLNKLYGKPETQLSKLLRGEEID